MSLRYCPEAPVAEAWRVGRGLGRGQRQAFQAWCLGEFLDALTQRNDI